MNPLIDTELPAVAETENSDAMRMETKRCLLLYLMEKFPVVNLMHYER